MITLFLLFQFLQFLFFLEQLFRVVWTKTFASPMAL